MNDARAIVDTIGEGRLAEPQQHRFLDGGAVPVREAEILRTLVGAGPLSPGAGPGPGGQFGTHGVGERAREPVIAVEIQMNVFVKGLLAGDPGRGGGSQRRLGIHQTNAVSGVTRGHLANNAIDARVGPEGQGIQIARLDEGLGRLREIGQAEVRGPELVIKLRIIRGPLERLAAQASRFRKVRTDQRGKHGLAELLPARQAGVAEAGRLDRCERRAVLQVARHGAEDDVGPAAQPGADDVFQVGFEAPIDRLLTRIVGRDRVLDEHLHALPGFGIGARPAEPRQQAVERLTQPRRLEREGGLHPGERRRLRPEHRAGTERPHHLVVAGIDDPYIRIQAGEFAGHEPQHVRIDGGDGGGNHLEAGLRIALSQQDLEVAACAVSGAGIAQRRRFPVQNNAHRVGGFLPREDDWRRGTRHGPREEAKAKLIIVHQHRPAVHRGRDQVTRRITVPRKAQGQFDHRQQGDRNQHRRQQSKPNRPPTPGLPGP